MSQMSRYPMPLRQVYYALVTPYPPGRAFPPIEWGDPGSAKTEMAKQIGRTMFDAVFCERFNDRLPEDIGGTPMPSGDAMRRWPPGWVRDVQASAKAGKRTLLIIDEATTCRQDVQAPLLGVIRDLEAGDEKMDPAWVRILVCANPIEQAPNGTELAHAVSNRVDHVEWGDGMPLDLCIDYWLTGHSVVYDLPPFDRDAFDEMLPVSQTRVAAFLQRFPDCKSESPKLAEGRGRGQYATTRSWEALIYKYATVLAYGDTEAVTAMATGLVGEPIALKFVTYVTDMDQPDPHDVVTGKVKLVDRHAAVYDEHGKPKAGLNQYVLDERRLDKIYSLLYSVALYVSTRQIGRGGLTNKEWNGMWENAWRKCIKPCMRYGKDACIVAGKLLSKRVPSGFNVEPDIQALITELTPVVREAGLQ